MGLTDKLSNEAQTKPILLLTNGYIQYKKMNLMKDAVMEANTEKLINFIGEKYENKELNNQSLVQIIELCGAYLNLQTISDYAKANGKSYNGVKKFRKTKQLFGVNFIIDNK
jgi:hypothetical protein